MLDQSGEVDRLAGLHDLAEVQSVTEDDIKAAIDELKRSTEAISKQSETMKQQKDALDKLVQKTAEGEARRQDFERSRQRRAESERKHIAAEVSSCDDIENSRLTATGRGFVTKPWVSHLRSRTTRHRVRHQPQSDH